MTTIVALSSGRPPAAIAVVRVSGPGAMRVTTTLVGTLPQSRRATLRSLRDGDGKLLDRALVLVFPGPRSATGEDLIELHCHGGRATVDAVLTALMMQPDVRLAEPGEFTRRAMFNGRIDLAQAEGLADLLEAETEAQRRLALAASEGRVSRAVKGWLDRLSHLSAAVEAVLDFADEGEIGEHATWFGDVSGAASTLRWEIETVLAAPPVERVRDGVRVVIAGPPNAGKSTLLNLMSQADAAIVSPIAGTTRDRVEVPIQRAGIAYRLIDTAGLTKTDDPIERIGVTRANDAVAVADILVWLGDASPPRADALWLHARGDLPDRATLPAGPSALISHDRPATIEALWHLIAIRAQSMLPAPDTVSLRRHQRDACRTAANELTVDHDPLICAEQLRIAHHSLASLLGINATEAMLDALFGRFCIGK